MLERRKGEGKPGDCAMLLLRLARCCRRPSLLSRIGLNEDLKKGDPKRRRGWEQWGRSNPNLS